MSIFKHPKIYIVGGAVRDEIMGLIPNDIDYVIEMNQEEFENEFPEIAKNKVGKSFPVYLHDGCEIALTRTEKSNGPGYNDFEVDKIGVSILEDLGRRDFSINAIAKNVLTGEIVDPFNGINDIKNKIVRVVSKESFSEDPLRMIRLVRFLARYYFNTNEETYIQLGSNIDKIKFISRERVLAEFKKSYDDGKFNQFISLMVSYGLMDKVFNSNLFNPMISIPAGPFQYHGNKSVLDHTLDCIEIAQYKNLSFDCMLALLFHDIGKVKTDPELYKLGHHYGHEERSFEITNKIVNEFPFTKEQKEFIPLVAKNHMKMHVIDKMRNIKLVKFTLCIPKKYFEDFINTCSCDHGYNLDQMKMIERMRKIRFHNFSVDDAEKIKNAKDKKETVIRLLNKLIAIDG